MAKVIVSEGQLAFNFNAVPENNLDAGKKTNGANSLLDAASKSSPEQDDGGNDRIEDFGEKIGGARKDLYSNGVITFEMIDSMTEAEQATIIKRDNIWPTIDMQAMKDAGYDSEVAAYIRGIRSALAPSLKIDKVYSLDEFESQHYAFYHKVVSGFKEICENIPSDATLSDAVEMLMIYGENTLYKREEKSQLLSYRDDGRMANQLRVCTATLFNRLFNMHSDRFSAFAKGKEWEQLLSADRGSPQKREQSVREHIRQFEYLDHVERSGGEDWRAGKDVREDDLMETFGFRGGEFGNWVTQKERQIVLNTAYDSLMDLSHALVLPPKAIGLDGSLAIAFGARGSGRANAHYEPGRQVFNLTKMRGAGSLAHEWYHALDNFIATRIDMDKKTSLHYASNCDSKYFLKSFNARIHQQVVDGNSERLSREALGLTKGYMNMAAICANLRYGGGARTKNPIEVLDRFTSDTDKGIAQYSAIDIGETLHSIGQGDFAVSYYRERGKRKRSRKKNYYERKAVGEQTGHGIRKFHTEAERLDDGTGKIYFSKPIEMAARAFEIFVKDTLEEQGVRSDYLVGPNKGKDFVKIAEDLKKDGASIDHLLDGEGKIKKIDIPNPYPSGDERKLFNQTYRKLFDELGEKDVLTLNVDKTKSVVEALEKSRGKSMTPSDLKEAAQKVASSTPKQRKNEPTPY